MSKIDEVLKLIEAVDFDKYKVIINVGGTALIFGREIVEILRKKGTMTQIQYLEISSKADLEDDIQRARLQSFIDKG